MPKDSDVQEVANLMPILAIGTLRARWDRTARLLRGRGMTWDQVIEAYNAHTNTEDRASALENMLGNHTSEAETHDFSASLQLIGLALSFLDTDFGKKSEELEIRSKNTEVINTILARARTKTGPLTQRSYRLKQRLDQLRGGDAIEADELEALIGEVHGLSAEVQSMEASNDRLRTSLSRMIDNPNGGPVSGLELAKLGRESKVAHDNLVQFIVNHSGQGSEVAKQAVREFSEDAMARFDARSSEGPTR